LEELYTNQFPMRILKMNVLHVLRLHLNHPKNSENLGLLAHKAQKTSASAFLMVKLFSKRFFQPSMLSQFSLLGTGTGFFLGGLFFVGKEKFSFMGKNGEKKLFAQKIPFCLARR
jgi:hypothetical protein